MITEQIDTLIYIVYNLFIKEVHVIKFIMIFYLQDKKHLFSCIFKINEQ